MSSRPSPEKVVTPEGANSPEDAGHALVEADAAEADDPFSDYSSDVSDTTSLRPSILTYTYENGRRYHAYRAGQYLLPNDEREQERLDITHHVFLLTLNGALCATKLDNPQAILDIGTGTGLWVSLFYLDTIDLL